MKKIVAVVIALALLCVGATAFAVPKKSLSPEDSALLTQIAEARATLLQGKSEINAMRTANYQLAAEIRNTISANGIKAIPSLKSKLLEIKG
ncbi:MAG: hypothetical protein Q8O09_01175, partial [Bacillota bacterium]|nr:hypothetical protein [Bacillota bacterium]